jgi:hypothetical protein
MIHTGNLEIITEIPSELLELITQYAHSVDCTTPNKFWTNAHVGVRTRRFDNGVRHPLIDRLLALPKFNGCADRLINYEFICLDAGGVVQEHSDLAQFGGRVHQFTRVHVPLVGSAVYSFREKLTDVPTEYRAAIGFAYKFNNVAFHKTVNSDCERINLVVNINGAV